MASDRSPLIRGTINDPREPNPELSHCQKTISFIILMIALSSTLGSYVFANVAVPNRIKKFDASAVALGMQQVAFSTTQLIAIPITATLSDKFGRKIPILVGLMLQNLGVFYLIFCDSIMEFSISQLICGLGTGAPATIMTAVTDFAEGGEQLYLLGLAGMVIALTTAFAPMAGGIVSSFFSFNQLVFVATIIGVIGALAALFYKDPRTQSKPTQISDSDILDDLSFLIGSRYFRMVFIGGIFLTQTMFSSIMGEMWVVTDVMNKAPFYNGLLTSLSSIFAVLTQLCLMNHLCRMYPAFVLARAGLLIMTAFCCILPFTVNFVIVSTALSGMFIGYAIAMPSFLQCGVQVATEEKRGAVMGWLHLAQPIGALIFSIPATKFLDLGGVFVGMGWLVAMAVFGSISMHLAGKAR